MNALAPVARPVFKRNHNWVMRNGATGIAELLDCRLLASTETPPRTPGGEAEDVAGVIRDWRRTTQVVALGVVDAEVAEAAQQLLVLDALGDGAHAEAGGDRDQ